jgi:PAS domain S-box-containing protein
MTGNDETRCEATGPDFDELRRAASQLRAFIAEAPAAFAMLDRDLRYIAASRRWLDDFGLGGSDLTGRSHYEVFPEIDARIRAVHRRSLAGETISCDEDQFVRDDGEVQWLRWDCRPWYEPGGAIGGIILFSEDITGQVAAREALHEREELFRVLFDQAPIGVAQSDAEGRLLRANATLQRMLGRTEAELVGRDSVHLTHPDDAGKTASITRRLIAGEVDRVEFETRFLHQDGRTVHVHVMGAPVRGSDDAIEFFISTVKDIGAHVEARAVLRESEALFRAVFERAPLGIVIGDRQGCFLRLNHAVQRMLGYDEPELIGKKSLAVSHPDDVDRTRAIIARLLGGETDRVELEKRYLHKDGHAIDAQVVVAAVRDAAGELEYFVGMIHDISKRKATETALRESEELFRTVFESAPLGVAIADNDGRFTRANKALQQALGYDEAEIVGKHFTEITHPDDIPTSFRSDRRMSRQLADRVELEKRYVGKDGRIVEAHVVVAPIHNDRGGIDYRVAMISDIRARKAAEQALRQSEERLRFALQAAGGGSWDWDLASGLAWWSPEMYALWGTEPGTPMRLENSLAAVHPDDRAGLQRAVEMAIEQKTDYRYEFRILHPERGESWLASLGRVVTGADGAPQRLIGLSFDITERKAMECALRRSEAMFRTLFERAPIGVAVIDAGGHFLRTNAALQQIVGYTGVELAGRHFREITHPDDTPRDARLVAAMLAGESDRVDIEKRYVHRDGNIIDVHVVVAPLWNQQHEIEYRIAMVSDIGERKRIAAALERDRRMQAVGQMAGGIAHDFNNLLAAIVGNLELAGRETDLDRVRDLMRRALAAAEAGAGFNQRLLSLANRGGTAPGVIDAALRLQELASLLAQVIGERIGIDTAVARDLWLVHVDRGELDSAIMNLCVNARDAMPEGGRLRLDARNLVLAAGMRELEPGAAPGDYVRISVEDEGCGMTEAVLARAIEPFFTTKPAGRGTGLGLGSVYSFVHRAGGFMTIASQPGQGTTVCLYLPRAAAETSSGAAPARGDIPYGDGELVLVVEDDNRVREMTLQRLEVLGYAVIEAATAADAIRLLTAGEPVAAVVSDVVMPGGLSGYDLAEWLRANRPQIGILLTSGYHDAALAGDRPPAPGTFLAKPHTLAELAQAVRRLLDPAAGR